MLDKKKKLLFVCYGLGIGGIEKCLVNLINVLPEKKYLIDVLLMNPEYTLKNQITREVNYLDSFKYVMNIEDTMNEIRKRGGVFQKLGEILSYLSFRIKIKVGKNAWSGFKPLPEEYDIAVAYSQNDYSPYYVIDKVKSQKKILWYHNGAYERTGKKYIRDKDYYNRFDYIVAVSSDCAKMLQSKFEFCTGKLVVLRNIYDVDDVKLKAKEYVPDSFDEKSFHIVTVGRMTSEKGANLAVEACRKLCIEGRDVCWHWIGEGNQAPYIKSMIEKYGIQNYFIMEGSKENPYPYMRCANIYIQPSYYEAYSTTIAEAKMLCRPIITTDVGGMRDQLKDSVNGLIVPVDADAIANAVGKLMDDESMRNRFSTELGKEDFGSKNSILEYERTVFN